MSAISPEKELEDTFYLLFLYIYNIYVYTRYFIKQLKFYSYFL